MIRFSKLCFAYSLLFTRKTRSLWEHAKLLCVRFCAWSNYMFIEFLSQHQLWLSVALPTAFFSFLFHLPGLHTIVLASLFSCHCNLPTTIAPYALTFHACSIESTRCLYVLTVSLQPIVGALQYQTKRPQLQQCEHKFCVKAQQFISITKAISVATCEKGNRGFLLFKKVNSKWLHCLCNYYSR